MLDALFGNPNITRILLFLFVNEHCYGTQLHRLLRVPLTPLQNALLRLEKGSIITSHCEGKTRLYQLNQSFPALSELEQLLKKAYTLLPPSEKKNYYLIRDEYGPRQLQIDNKTHVLLAFWEKLSTTRSLTFTAKSKLKNELGWNGKGKGDVLVIKEKPHVMVFNEKGSWQSKQTSDVDFSNIFRWSLDQDNGVISLTHLRRGPDHPIFLFDLAPSGNSSLSSVDAHLCEGDIYFGRIHFDRQGFRLHWRIIGPNKNEELSYFYSSRGVN